MKKEFEYKPFDRVTVDFGIESVSGVLFDVSGTLLSGAYADPYGLNNFNAGVDNTRPGHYDADGNWLPQPGEPCHVILPNGSPKNMVVICSDAHHVEAIGEYDTEKTVYFKTSLGFVDRAWYFDMPESGDIPQSALLHPGRIKTTAPCSQ